MSTPLDEILAVRRISAFGHTARLEGDVPAHMVLRRYVDLSLLVVLLVPSTEDSLVDPALDG